MAISFNHGACGPISVTKRCNEMGAWWNNMQKAYFQHKWDVFGIPKVKMRWILQLLPSLYLYYPEYERKNTLSHYERQVRGIIKYIKRRYNSCLWDNSCITCLGLVAISMNSESTTYSVEQIVLFVISVNNINIAIKY